MLWHNIARTGIGACLCSVLKQPLWFILLPTAGVAYGVLETAEGDPTVLAEVRAAG